MLPTEAHDDHPAGSRHHAPHHPVGDGAQLADNWEALARTMALFRQAAVEVGEHLGYAYPHDLHRRVSAHVEHIKQMEPPAASSKNNAQP